MRLKQTPLKVTAEDPFAEDLLDRRVSADALMDFVSAIEEPFVLALTAPFGGGKSTFIRMWLEHIRNAGFTALHFNAWENDFTDSPLVALIGELGGLIEQAQETAEPGKAKELLRKAKKIAPNLAKAALPGLVRVATAGIVDPAALGRDFGDVAGELVKQQIDSYDSDKRALHKFRTTLGQFVKSVRGSSAENRARPVVFVIDELDRCRPDYAITLLEKVKHLFNVEGLVFVLAVDRHQLSESARTLYGSGFNSDGYLRRFVDLEFQLPSAATSKFVELQFERFGLTESFKKMSAGVREDVSGLEYILPGLCELFDFSPRAIEQLFTQLSVILRMTGSRNYVNGVLLAFLLVLRSVDRQQYEDFCAGRIDYAALLERLKTMPGFSEFLTDRRGAMLEAYLISTLADQQRRNAIIDELQRAAESGQKGPNVDRAGEVIQCMRWARTVGPDSAARLYRRIEISQRLFRLEKIKLFEAKAAHPFHVRLVAIS